MDRLERDARRGIRHDVVYVLTPDKPCAARYRAAGLNAHWQTRFADTRVFRLRNDVVERWDCVTTCGPRGNGLTERIQAALGECFNNERYFHGEEHGKRLCMGKIVFQKSNYGEVTRRIFEGMSCGKMVITDRLPEDVGLASLFEEDVDIVYYATAEEAIDKIRYYASHDAPTRTRPRRMGPMAMNRSSMSECSAS